MTDSSMNFGPAWIRNLRSEGTTGSGGGAAGTNMGATRYQLAEHRYGREEMLAIFDRSLKPPPSLTAFKALYSEQILTPLALLPTSEEERSWQARPSVLTAPSRGRGVSLERGSGGRPTRGRGNYPTYGRTTSAYDSGWGNGEQPEWSPRKEYNSRSNSTDNWRRVRNNNTNNNNNNEDDEGWRSITSNRPLHEKWGRSTSWRGEGDTDERNGPPERGGRVQHWHENRGSSTSSLRRSWDIDDHLPEWIHENPTEGGGTFDERGAFHGSDDEQFCGDHHQQQQQQQKRKELQKSASQQQISNSRNHPPSLTTSKSAIALSKINDNDKQSENLNERDKEPSKIKEESDLESEKSRINDKNNLDDEGNRCSKIEEDTKSAISDRNHDNRNSISTNNGPPPDSSSRNIDKVEEEFARMQEDLVLKLVVDEETPKATMQNTSSPSSSSSSTVTGVTTTSTTTTYDVTNPVVQPPPNLVVPPPPPPSTLQEKWYYQDPQGTRQGPFLNVEMAEWYKAGYFSNQLRVMRECDERYFLLGELINLCGGDNPFLSNIRFPILKNDTQHQQQQTKLNDDMLSYQLLSQLAFKQQISMRNLAEPWSALTLQQQELAAQRLLLQQQQQQQQQLPHDLQYMQQSTPPPPPPPANPLMFMINQMQQSNKLPGSVLIDKSNSSSSVPNQLDPLLVQMGGIHSLQNRIPTPNLHNHLPGGLPTNLSSTLPTTDSLTGGLPGLQTAGNPLPTLPGLHGGLPTPGLNHRPTSHSPIDQLPQTNQENDPITNFLKQFHQQKQRTQIPPMDGSLWHKPPNQFNVPQSTTPTTTTTQWAQQPDVPLSMWDLQPTPLPTCLPPDNHQPIPIDKTTTTTDPIQNHEIDKEQHHQQHKLKEETTTQKELKKKKEIEEKHAKKEAEEKRKQEQRKQEADKKAADEKKKKEEERVRKELERAKKEAEEKRMRELEEKRRLKEQRKAEEEAKKKSDELRKQEEDKLKKEAKEREEQRKQSEARLTQHQVIKTSKTAPWCQSNSTQGMSLTDIQKAEKERRAQEAALLLKQQQLQEQHQQQQQQQQAEKTGGLQLNWAKKPMEPRSVKSFAEIQAEEQEKLAKMTAEARLAAQQREKEAPTTTNTNSIWNGQSLSWANATSTSQWSSNNAGAGFWDDVFVKSSTKPSTIAVPKSSSTSAMTSVVTATAAAAATATVKQQQQQPQKQTKPKPKKEESQKSVNSNNNNNNNNSANDEFTNWCYKTLSTISTNVDIPTFVSFLRDIESAYDVKDYCKEYLGDGAAIQQFAANFLEKRRSFKPKTNAHKDDMCSPAPAITPSTQHSTEFQEVKGKNKKNKKSKMLKVDSRILGFQVTSAPDRINVGDRDYGDNS